MPNKHLNEATTFDALIAHWKATGDLLPLCEYLLEQEDLDRLSVWCRLALADEEDEERRGKFETLLYQTARAPEHWDRALEAFSENPSFEAWKALFQWVPEDDVFHRQKLSIRRLKQLGVDPDLLFLCASQRGASSDAIELADTGAASPEVIVQRGAESNIEAFYTALAAHSAATRGDQPLAVWLANRAVRIAPDAMQLDLVTFQIEVFAKQLDAAHQRMLDRRVYRPK